MEVSLVGIKSFLRHVCWQPQFSILALAVHECIHAAKNSVEHLDPALWGQHSLAILPWIFSPSPTESPSAPDFYHSLGVRRLNPYSKRLRTRRAVFLRSRGKPQDRWLSRQGNKCAEQVSDVNDSTEYFLFLEQEKKSSSELMGKEHSSVL